MSGTVAAIPDPNKDALLKLFNELWGDAEIGEPLRRRAKAINPSITIPDDHPIATGVRKELAAERARTDALQQQIADDRAAREQERRETTLRADLGRAQSRFKLTDDGLKGTMQLMQERQIADAEAAAALYVDSLPKLPPSSPANAYFPGKFNLFGTTAADEKWRQLHEDPDAYFADTVADVFREMPVGG